MFRARTLHLYNIRVQREHAYQLVTLLSKFDVNLLDMNAQSGAREYSNQLKRCEDIIAKLNEVAQILHQFGIPVSRCPNYAAFLGRRTLYSDYLASQETDLTHRLDQLNQLQTNFARVVEKKSKLLEQKYRENNNRAVVECTANIVAQDQGFLQRIRQRGHLVFDEQGIHVNPEAEALRKQNFDLRLNCISGCLNSLDVEKFHRVLFRASRQNAIARFWSHDLIPERSVFMILYSSGVQDYTRKKIARICETFAVVLYDLPNDGEEKDRMLQTLNEEILALDEVINETKAEITQNLSYFADIHSELLVNEIDYEQIYASGLCSHLEEVRLNIQIEASVYFHLNFFETKFSLVHGQMWCQPEIVDQILASNHIMPIQIIPDLNEQLYEPPTLLKKNCFVNSFQDLVNTYGLPRYGEINPGLFTIITFPFLFGIMFGDIGHGSLLAFFGFYLILFGDRLVRSVHKYSRSDPSEYKDVQALVSAKYLLTLMGCFACYSGFIYNDFFSTALNYSNSCIKGKSFITNCTPQFGFDGGWSLTNKDLAIMNSFKMKAAIVIGVIHMTFGILLKGWNSLYMRKPLDFFCEFIPQLLFMSATFGYMSFLIVIKWLTYYEDSSKAPSIITTLLTMYFTLGGVNGDQMFPQQVEVQQRLIAITLIAPFWMLFPKPIIKIMIHKMQRRAGHLELAEEEEQADLPAQAQSPEKSYGMKKEAKLVSEEKHFSPMEVSIEAAIETIEFVLGAVSNTASYLRLWALSLAHSQLSGVFFDMTLKDQLASGSVLGICLGFAVFASITFMVLMCMDTLECFLHALRLHWVEFQNKFYKADGFSFQTINWQSNLELGVEFSSRM